jgi:hypothetical protein
MTMMKTVKKVTGQIKCYAKMKELGAGILSPHQLLHIFSFLILPLSVTMVSA